MNGYLKLACVIYWLALIVWISAIIGATVAEINVLPSLDDMPLELTQCPGYPAEAHPRLAARRIMDGVRFLADMMQFAAIPLVVITLITQVTIFRQRITRPANAVRAACVLAAACLFAYNATMIAPKMNRALRDSWTAGEIGDVETALAQEQVFNQYRPRADTVMRINLLLLIIAAGSSATALAPSPTVTTARLEEPKLLKKP